MTTRADTSAPAPAPTARLTAHLEGPITCLTRDQWHRLFPSHPDPYQNVVLAQTAGMPGLTFRTILVRRDQRPVLAIPTFEARFNAATMASGFPRTLLRAAAPFLPFLLRPKLLGVGLVECEWGSVGQDPDLAPDDARAAWHLGFATLFSLARSQRSHAIALLDLDASTLARAPADLLTRFVPVDTSPCAAVALPFTSTDDYLASLSRSTRQGLRRKHRAASALRIERTTNPAPHLPRLLDLYHQTVARSPVVLGIQPTAYFERVCAEVPGAHYVLYFDGDHLLAFNLLIHTPHALVDKYFAMDEAPGRALNLYFVSWLENIRFALEHRLPAYHAGPGAHETKQHLGCTFRHNATLFRHQNPIAHAVLAFLARTVVNNTGVKNTAVKEPPIVVSLKP